MSKSAQVPLHTWLPDAIEGYSKTLKYVILGTLIIQYMWACEIGFIFTDLVLSG